VKQVYSENVRSGAFAVATPNYIGLGVRRPSADPSSGYAVWQLANRPFVIASPALEQIAQEELIDRVNGLARINDARSSGQVRECIEHVLMATPVSEELALRQFKNYADKLGGQIATYTEILRRDLICQGLCPDISSIIRQATPCAIRGYMRGWSPGLENLSKAKLVEQYRITALSSVTARLRCYDIDFALAESICDLIFDEIMSARLSILSKQFIVAGFWLSEPRLSSVDLDGVFAGQVKMSVSEYWEPWLEGQSFFLDAGNCYEVGCFARGNNSAAQQQAVSVTENLLHIVNKRYANDIGMWNNLEVMKPTTTDVATLAIKSAEFNAAGLFGTPLSNLKRNASAPELLKAIEALGRVADLQDELIGTKDAAWSEVVVLGPSGIVAKSRCSDGPVAATRKKRRKAA
jgi:hypothetical protein